MDPRARGFAVPAALSVVVIAGLAAECKSDSETRPGVDAGDGASGDASVDASDGSIGSGGAGGADAPVIVLGGSGGTPCGSSFASGACPGTLVCMDGGPDAEAPCCQCYIA